MPKMNREEIQERKRFVLDTWKKLWPRTSGSGQKLPTAAKVNELIKAKFGENMRSDKLYAIRDEAIAWLREQGHDAPHPSRKSKGSGQQPAKAVTVTAAGRGLQAPPRTVSSGLPIVVRGLSPTEAAAIRRALDELRQAGAANLVVEHSADTYVVIGLAP